MKEGVRSTVVNSQSSERSPRGEGHLLRIRILEAASDLLEQASSAADVSVREIAAAVGRTVPALYQHFPDKAALVTAAAQHALDGMGEAVALEIAGEADLDVRLRHRAHAFVDFALAHPTAYRHLFMSPPGSASSVGSIDVVMDSVGFAGLVADLEEARMVGLMVDRSPREVAIVLWTAVHGVASLLISHPELDWPVDLLDVVLDQHALGIVPR